MCAKFSDIPSFVDAAEAAIARAASNVRFRETRQERVIRRFSLNEIAEFIGCDRTLLYTILKHPDAPAGETRGKERTFSIQDLMKIRALNAARPTSRRETLFWRDRHDPLPVVVFSSQKGGTGKTTATAHFAQAMNLYYGLRVGVIDCDPQASCSLYFVGGETEVAGPGVSTFTDFMGVPEPGATNRLHHPAEELDGFFQPTPWPGLRLLPGGVSIQEADIAMYYLTRTDIPENRRIYRMLRDAIGRWSQAYPPRTQPADLLDESGRFREEAFASALSETFDLLVIDTAPSLSLAQLNAVVAGSSLVIPQTMRGFDLSTLQIYLSSLNDYLRFVLNDQNPVTFDTSHPMILPSIVNRSSDTDLRTIGEIYATDPDIISPVYYRQNDGTGNAFREYKSAYEYNPGRSRRASLRAFIENANAVNDAIVRRTLPHLPSRGWADAFIAATYPEGTIPNWSQASSDTGVSAA